MNGGIRTDWWNFRKKSEAVYKYTESGFAFAIKHKKDVRVVARRKEKVRYERDMFVRRRMVSAELLTKCYAKHESLKIQTCTTYL